MMLFVLILLCISMFFLDIWKRKISLWQLTMLALVGMFDRYNNGLDMLEPLLNLIWVGLFIVVSMLFTRIILKRSSKDAVGVGDWLMMIAIAPYFDLLTYSVFIVSGLIFSLFIGLIITRIQANKTIPLAGLLSLWFVMFLFKSKEIVQWFSFKESTYLG